MRQLTVVEGRHLEWRDVPAPCLASPESALVRPVAVATCDFDHLMVSGAMPLPVPIAIGHEFVADVVETGAAVTGVKAGDRVVVSFQISCGVCGMCRRGLTSSCERMPSLSCFGLGPLAGDWGGAMSDLVAVPYADAMLVKLPAGMPPAHAAACSCNIPDAYRCVGPQLLERPGAPVFIAGGAFGSIGLYAVAMARAMGAAHVDYVDADPARAAVAEKLGARVLRAADVVPGSYPITVDASQDVDLLALAIKATAPAGECTVSPMYIADTTPVPLFQMFQNCVTLRTGQPHIRAHLEAALALAASGALPVDLITDAVVAWEAAPTAFAAGKGKIVCVR